jgi:hypothetical protein
VSCVWMSAPVFHIPGDCVGWVRHSRGWASRTLVHMLWRRVVDNIVDGARLRASPLVSALFGDNLDVDSGDHVGVQAHRNVDGAELFE